MEYASLVLTEQISFLDASSFTCMLCSTCRRLLLHAIKPPHLLHKSSQQHMLPILLLVVHFSRGDEVDAELKFLNLFFYW